MPSAALLALALALVEPSPAEIVRAVRIEAEQPQPLRRFVELGPGQPLDREAIRRAVERMFATGRYEDVPVELVRDEAGPGVTVVFRPRLAPLLIGVRIEGDPALSPAVAARAARLRPGEPLWPSRLERASRDVALALVRRGHLEALAPATALRTPTGAFAVFKVHAGPQVRVSRASVELTRPVPGLVLAALVRPRPGEIYAKQRAEAAREAITRRLLDAGYWHAAVDLRETYDPGRARMSIVFRADPGPHVQLETRGARVPDKLRDGVRDLVREGGASTDALEAGAERIDAYLRAQGYREAAVRAQSEPDAQGETIVYELRTGPRAIARAVLLRGADPALLEALRTRPGRPIDDAVLEEDARLLAARLSEQGHFEARVDTDIPDGGGELTVVFVAQPGPRAFVRSVEIQGPPLPLSSDDRGPEELAARAGQPYRLADVARSRETLLAGWRRAGYLDARVLPQVRMSDARDQALVVFTVDPGARTIVDQVVLAGLGRTRAGTVEREMVLRPGEPFSFERVLESQRRLSGLGIFERVSISELDPTQPRRDVVVSVQEAPRTSLSWGVGYSEPETASGNGELTLDLHRVRGSVEATRRNLGGVGRTASLLARGSFRGSRVLFNLREPRLFGRKLDSFLNGFWEEEVRPSFDYNRKGGTLQVGRTVAHTSLVLRYTLQDTSLYEVKIPLDEIDRQYRTYTVSGPAASVVFDSRDDPLEPRRGVFLGGDLQLSLSAFGGASYLRGLFQATSVRRLRADLVMVLSGRLGLAGTFGPGSTLLPLPERFFAGGDFGPRGFAFDSVGPHVTGSNGELYPTGGNALVLGGAEMRYNLTRSLQLASFLDLGNVYTQPGGIELSALRRSAGLGVRYRTPVGPIRLDWGLVLDHKPGESYSRFHLTIGHAF